MFSFFKKLFSPVIAILDFITKYFKTVVFLTIMYFIVFDTNSNNISQMQKANLQKIELSGPILDSNKVIEQINKAKTDKNIKGVLLVVNSPGGAVAPSIEIAYAIKELNKLKPVVAYASGVMASGSYYASIWANQIIANPGSMIGSIGVILQGTNVEELMDKIGIETQTVKAGKYKESGTFTRTWTSYEKEELEKVIEDTYDIFITDVSSARGLKKSNHENYADAHIFTARQAKDVKLIDEVATLTYAKSQVEKLSKVDIPIWQKQDKFEKFIDRVINEATTNIASKLQSSLKAY
ncbi:MAG: signal peptide peptidase SppA [Campylobacterota bacterium]